MRVIDDGGQGSATGRVARAGEAEPFYRRTFSVHVEMLVLALVLAVWQLARIPLEGSLPESLDHAREWVDLERSVHIHAEPAIVDLVRREVVHGVVRWSYGNLHEAAIFAFMAAARLYAPARYAKLRSAFVLSHLPALAVIGLYPLAPPLWLHAPPSPGYLTGGLGEQLRNATAAAASMHFGYAFFIAAGALWLAPRSPIAWLACLYPPYVLVIIVGTENHYVLDAVVGLLCVCVGAALAQALHGPVERAVAPERSSPVIAAAATAYAAIGWGLNDAAQGHLPTAAVVMTVAAALLAVLERRWRGHRLV